MRSSMITISQIAKRFKISRSTILYYEREGLLEPTNRSDNGYRWFGDKAIKRLESIVAYRSFGLPLDSINKLLDQQNEGEQSALLKAHFEHLENEIAQLRRQQAAIIDLLKDPTLMEKEMVTKERWTEIMRASGFSDQDMINWHKKFEEMEPQEHQLFLESLGISEQEIKRIRAF